jgi:hypothetical protein
MTADRFLAPHGVEGEDHVTAHTADITTAASTTSAILR